MTKKKETSTGAIAGHSHKLGGDKTEGKCKEGYVWDADEQKCVPADVSESFLKDITQADIKNQIKEATTSGWNGSAAKNVAGTDTRFGGPTFEPLEFEEKSKENDMIRNEKVFWKDTNTAVLLPGWTYVEDLEASAFSDIGIEDNDLDDETIDRKEKHAVDWSLDYNGTYRELLQRLKKAKNT
jgi:hypothetical protein